MLVLDVMKDLLTSRVRKCIFIINTVANILPFHTNTADVLFPEKAEMPCKLKHTHQLIIGVGHISPYKYWHLKVPCIETHTSSYKTT